MTRKAESKARPRRRRNPELAAQHIAPPGIPAGRFNLTPKERAHLPDPDWVTEDDADYIIGMRGEQQGKPIPLAKVLKRYGCQVED